MEITHRSVPYSLCTRIIGGLPVLYGEISEGGRNLSVHREAEEGSALRADDTGERVAVEWAVRDETVG